MVFSDGVFFDPADQLFKMWYMGGYQQHTALAVSHDGLSWERPALDVVPRHQHRARQPVRDSSTVWLDLEAHDPASASRWRRSTRDAGAAAATSRPTACTGATPA